MLEYQKNTNMLVPVVLVNSSGQAITGTVVANITATIIKSNGVQQNVAITAPVWNEVTGAYTGSGYYNWTISSSYSDVSGLFQYCVSSSLSTPYFGVVKIVDGDTTDIYNRVGAPVSGTVSADVRDIRNNLSSGGSGSASVDLSPIIKVLGVPIQTISTDVRQIGKIVQDVQKKVS